MIRRGFWLGLGAVLGITGYRKLVKLGRALAPLPASPAGRFSAPRQPGGSSAQLGQASLTAVRVARGIGSETASFIRDVRAGMAEYPDSRGELLNRQAGS